MTLMRKNALNICLLAAGSAVFPLLVVVMYIAFQHYGPLSNITRTVTVLTGLSNLISVPSLIILGVLYPKYLNAVGVWMEKHKIMTMAAIFIFGLVIVPLVAKSLGYQPEHRNGISNVK